jgi:hypothetical protein
MVVRVPSTYDLRPPASPDARVPDADDRDRDMTTDNVIPFPVYKKGTHWRNPATCVVCGDTSVVFEETCRYCSGFHPERHCEWEHERMGWSPPRFLDGDDADA